WVSMAGEAGAATGLEKSEKRGVQAARNGPSEGTKCWQRVELGIHGLRSWGRNWSRKVRETRSSSSQTAACARSLSEYSPVLPHCPWVSLGLGLFGHGPRARRA